MLRTLALLSCLSAASLAGQSRFAAHRIATLGARIRGAEVHGGTLITWGERIVSRDLPSGTPHVLRGTGTPLAEGGCLTDVDGDGRLDLVVNESGPEQALVWLQAPRWTRHVIDTGIDAPDIVPATLFGRRGVLLIQKRIQIRFYQTPADPARRWPSQDVYSVYTPSWQGGLRIAQIDGEGQPDLLCGNYWVRAPAAFDLPWHLFAINTWTENEKSGMMRLVYADLFGSGSPVLLAAQRAMEHARLAWFAKPADPKLIWEEHRLETGLDLSEPASLDVADLDGDRRPDILIAEKAAPARLILLHNRGNGRFEPEVLQQGSPVDYARAIDLNGDGRPGILAVTRSAISWWENRPGTR